MEDQDEKIKKLITQLEKNFKEALPEGWGFSLFVVRLNGKGVAFHVSSLSRDYIRQMLGSYLRATRRNLSQGWKRLN